MVLSGQQPRPHWQNDRSAPEHSPNDDRYYELGTIRPPPLTIDRALREQCQINAQYYFLAARLDDGSHQYFSGPRRLETSEIRKIFDMDRFLHHQRRGAAASSFQDDPGFPYEDVYHRESSGPDYAGRRSYDRRRVQAIDPFDDEGGRRTTRKRPRAQVYQRDLDDDEPPVMVSSKKGIKIGNSEEVWNFYDQRFRNCQQTACKLIAKIFVKTIAPKKQSNNPYTQSDERAPDWWPKPWGTTKDEKVRHKEPDHLWKKERLYLLNHILRMVVEPNAKQHKDIQKLDINVAKLEDVTMDALSTWFADKEKPGNAKKKPYLKEIFKVAKVEEQYKNGEIDGNTEVFVMADDKIPDNYQSDDDIAQSKDEEEKAHSVTSSRVSPPKTTAPHSMMPAPGNDHSPATNVRASSFMSDIPVRGIQYPPPVMPSDLGPEQHSYVESGSMPVGGQAPLHTHGTIQMQDMIPSAHDSSRRQSLYNSPAELPGPSGAGLYSSHWQQATTAPGNAPLYAFTPHQQAPQPPSGAFVPQQAVPINQSHQYSFNELPHSTNMFRSSSIGQPPVPQGQSYPNYLPHLPHDGRAVPSSGLKMAPPNRGPLQ
ncbi:hypothetical protein B0T24DRAFT_170561 [Lasiosphaeria ovina]|uniref:Subtelomeric hrmA-associated cluster protein AFUB-079030/YDR124W-like helical bundle domain-containing protein n=1 Tax=Lasiosphaeria ovina TaxID=92902 RepID=A0AAE0NE40_9PEZI|nr:hypothetical protein B0T24DRAFT_170561 [Lasiosphaeria ovina]